MIASVSQKDWDAIYDIYSFYVENSTAIFDIKPMEKIAFIEKMEGLSNSYPFYVAKVENEVIGYVYGQPAFSKEAYKYCVEISIYFKKGNHYGLARPLMDTWIDACKEKGFRWIIACITDTNTSSINFHQTFGFQKSGKLPHCGYKMDQWNGVVWMVRDLQNESLQRIATNAVISGKVFLEEEVNIWYNAILRADNDVITIGKGTNIQENVVVHTDPGYPVSIGKNCTIGHGAIIHGATIDTEVLVGMGAILLNGCKIGKHSIIGAGALVTEGMNIPERSVVVGSPARVIKSITEKQIQEIQESAKHYIEQAKKGMEIV